MTTDGVPGGPSAANTPPPVASNLVDFINGPMPTPSPEGREASLSMPSYEGKLPNQDTQAPTQPAPMPVPASPQPDVVQPAPQPSVPQPNVVQPAPQQPAPSQPPTPNYEQMYTQQVEQTKQLQARESAFETQRQEIETQRQTNQEQQVKNAAGQHAMTEYQKYLAANVPDAQAREWAMSAGKIVYDALNVASNQQQAQTQTQTIAQRHGINAADIPQGMDAQAMDVFAGMKRQLNDVQAQSQATSTNQIQQRQFDSNQGTAPADPAAAFFQRTGDPTKLASRTDMAQMMEFLKTNTRV